MSIAVVTGLGKSPDECVSDNFAGGCIVARRRIRFVDHTTLTLPIRMDASCVNVVCPAQKTCEGGTCVPVECAGTGTCSGDASTGCPAGTSDCNGDPADACETNLQDDPDNCGACSHACGQVNAQASCAGALCTFQCASGYAHCDGVDENGCETDLSKSPEHCGACGHGCQGGQCTASICQAVALGATPGAYQTTVLNDNVFFTSVTNASAVYRWDATSGVVQIASNQATPDGIAADEQLVYWTSLNGGAVRSAAHDGSNRTDVATNQAGPRGVALSNGDIFWTNAGTNASGFVDGQLMVRPSGGAVTQLAGSLRYPRRLSVDGGYVYWADGGHPTQQGVGGVKRIKTSGGSVETLVGGVNVSDIALDATHVYWVDQDSVRRLPRAGGSEETLAAGLDIPNSLEVDDVYAYFTTVGEARIWRVTKSGGTPAALSPPLAKGPGGLSADATAIYFGVQGETPNWNGAGLFRVAK